MSLFEKFGDGMLARLVPTRQAAAGCPHETYYEYRCNQGKRQIRTCTVLLNCTSSCGTWRTFDLC
ncbi:hypothetical protein LX16_4861 [Stackebrandtia albiflava]|uniref:Uncharacterized protein n=1 Tax=Stackebrandtia albiflava TaxID=406432 RepID=A0A562UQ06_9ACTN|nr:hypothetical protein [Stackebrandtia albiflava]TWJ07702.1 hypothetical protein LX16_4861 [Stackebrandtia albiflava]